MTEKIAREAYPAALTEDEATLILNGRGWTIKYEEGMWCFSRGMEVHWSNDFEALIRKALSRP